MALWPGRGPGSGAHRGMNRSVVISQRDIGILELEEGECMQNKPRQILHGDEDTMGQSDRGGLPGGGEPAALGKRLNSQKWTERLNYPTLSGASALCGVED